MPEPIIRRAGSNDAEAIAAIGRATFLETFAHLYAPSDLELFLPAAYGLERTKGDLADPAKATWVVEIADAVVGYALAGPCALPHGAVTDDCGELKRLYFLKAHQNVGLGRRLFTQALDWLQSAGPRTVWIGVWSENLGAQRFYARHGFEQVGTYGFAVGTAIDREFIMRRDGASFSTGA